MVPVGTRYRETLPLKLDTDASRKMAFGSPRANFASLREERVFKTENLAKIFEGSIISS